MELKTEHLFIIIKELARLFTLNKLSTENKNLLKGKINKTHIRTILLYYNQIRLKLLQSENLKNAEALLFKAAVKAGIKQALMSIAGNNNSDVTVINNIAETLAENYAIEIFNLIYETRLNLRTKLVKYLKDNNENN